MSVGGIQEPLDLGAIRESVVGMKSVSIADSRCF